MRSLPILLILTTACFSEQNLSELEDADPSFSVTSPERASWHSEGGMALTGDVHDIDSLIINGLAYDVDGESFSVPVELDRGINYFEIEALAADGSSFFDRRAVIAGEFAPATGEIEDAAALRINQGGLDDISEIVAELIDTQDINNGITALNPVVELEYSLGTGISVDLRSIYFNTPLIDLVATNGTLEVEVILPNLFVDTDAELSVLWIDSDQSLEMVADYAVIDVELGVDVSNGVVELETLSTEVSLDGFSYDISLLPGEIIEDNVFDDTIRGVIEDKLAEKIGTMLPDILAGLQEDLELGFDFELLGTQIGLEGIVADIGLDNAGLWMDLDLSVDAGGGNGKGEGYLYSGVSTPTPDRSADGPVLISDDAMNRALYELWAGGIFSQTLSTEDGSLSADSLSGYGISSCTIETSPGLPPVLVEVDGSTHLQLGEMEVVLTTPGFALGEYIKLRVAASVSVDIVFENGSVRPVLSDIELHPDVVETDWSQDEESIVNLMNTFLTPELLLGAVEDIAIEIPSIPGIEIDDADIARASTGFHTALQLNISAD